MPESGQVAKASDNQVGPMREVRGPLSEKLYLEVGEATLRMGWGVRVRLKVGMCFPFNLFNRKEGRMLVLPPVLEDGSRDTESFNAYLSSSPERNI